MTNRSPLVLALVMAGVLAASPADAQTRYQSWQNPALDSIDGSGSSAQDLVTKLRKLIDEAEKARAADPQFLTDLRNLANSHDRPWNAVLLDDSFADGDFTQNPVWTVTAGRYWIESGYGLRSSVIAAAPAEQQTQRKVSREELVIGVLGAVLGAQQKQQTQQQATQAEPRADMAAIHHDGRVSNAFAIRLEMASWKADGRIEIGPAQSQYGNGGYRLAYGGGTWELIRVGSRGSSVVDVASAPKTIEDNKVHTVEWTRGRDGKMTVSLDGAEILSATDRGFRDDFDRLVVVNRTGDFTLRRVTVSGVN